MLADMTRSFVKRVRVDLPKRNDHPSASLVNMASTSSTFDMDPWADGLAWINQVVFLCGHDVVPVVAGGKWWWWE